MVRTLVRVMLYKDGGLRVVGKVADCSDVRRNEHGASVKNVKQDGLQKREGPGLRCMLPER